MTLAIEGRIRVVVDVDTVSGDDGQGRFLLALLQQNEVETFKYSDLGPPAEELKRADPNIDIKVCPGWLLFEPSTSPTWDDQGRVSYTTGKDTWHCCMVMGGGDFLAIRRAQAAEQLGPLALNKEQVRRDLTAQLAVSAASAHLFVTARPVLLDQPSLPAFDRDCAAADVEDAVAIVGVWLRAKGVYIVLAEGCGKATVDRHAFYMIALRNLLHESWRWGHGCTASGDPVLHDLSIALHRRLVTALKARDRSRTAGFFMAEAAARDEVLECVDVVALNLMAAFDVAARVAHRVLSIQKPNPSWLYEKWVQQLPRPGLGSVLDSHHDVLTLISKLRNTIHDKAMHLGTIQHKQDGDADFYVVLPADHTNDLRSAFEALGGLPAWGVREFGAERLWAEPLRLIELLLRRGIHTLNELLAATPVESLAPGVTLQTEPLADDWVWSPGARRNVSWQMGLREHGSGPPSPT